MDPRYNLLAKNLTAFSVALKKGDHVLIDSGEVPEAMLIALIRETRALGAIPHVFLRSSRISRELIKEGVEEQFTVDNAVMLYQMKRMQAYIALRGSDNIFESSDVSPERMKSFFAKTKPTLDYRVKKTRWVILRWPTPAMAQQAGMSTEGFEDFYFRVCTLDYGRMQPGMKALQKLMDATSLVEIKGPGTDLTFSIEKIPSVPCGGHFNIPDGEVFTAPVRNSVEGEITYNAPTVYQGISFDQVKFRFQKGKIVEATAAANTEKLNAILDSDSGARYVGEFAIGFNPHILKPMRDILFDEKIAGSFHFTPGQAYEDADNGNRSQVHWDLVQIQRPEYGGGEIRFDGKVIRRDGIFVPKTLQKLNPEYLLAE
ncbi:MAG: aminopeptidase [Puniceicoccaceae bacterium]